MKFVIILLLIVNARLSVASECNFTKGNVEASIVQINKTPSNGGSPGSGTGFVIYKENKYVYILTAYHVVADHLKLIITSKSKTDYLENENENIVLKHDDKNDLAILKIKFDKNDDFNKTQVLNISKETDIYDSTDSFYSFNYKNDFKDGTISNVDVNKIKLGKQFFSGDSGSPLLLSKSHKLFSIVTKTGNPSIGVPLVFIKNLITNTNKENKIQIYCEPNLGKTSCNCPLIKLVEENSDRRLVEEEHNCLLNECKTQ